MRRGAYTAVAPWVPPLEHSLLLLSVTVAVDLVISAALYAMPARAAAVGGDAAAAAAAAVATAAADELQLISTREPALVSTRH